MQLSTVLQVALILASVAIVIFVACCLPALLQLRKHAARMTQTLEDLKIEVSGLVQDSRTLLRSVNELSTRANQQCDHIEQVIHTVRRWTARVDHVVEEVGTVLEPPLLTAAWSAQVIRRGVTKFFETFFNGNHHNT